MEYLTNGVIRDIAQKLAATAREKRRVERPRNGADS